MKVASISELKDSLSAHLERVRAGELVVVTDRRSPVATLERIAPGTMHGGVMTLISEGIVAPRKEDLNLEAFFSTAAAQSDQGLVSAIADERKEGR
jgi:antitoxin (DNA-binding transcriptional repressor) of toxin-antitoxin stability system